MGLGRAAPMRIEQNSSPGRQERVVGWRHPVRLASDYQLSVATIFDCCSQHTSLPDFYKFLLKIWYVVFCPASIPLTRGAKLHE
jgi:hypothetical protein